MLHQYKLKRNFKVTFPKDISPMLATPVDSPFKNDDWSFEPKLDGVRALAYVQPGKVNLRSRRGLDLTAKYPLIEESLSVRKGEYVFDGEICALNKNGIPTFQGLQRGTFGLRSFDKDGSATENTLVYYIFDILFADGDDLKSLPLSKRREILASVLQTNQTVRLVEQLGSDGEAAFEACASNGLEGVVAKENQSRYEVGKRAKNWLKIKTSRSEEFLVCGFTEGTGARKGTFGSLLLGEYDDEGELKYVGGVGTGFNDAKLKALLAKMKRLIRKTCPFGRVPKGKLNPTWLKPELIAEVKFLERTNDNILRAPVFISLRDDKEPEQIKMVAQMHVEVKANNALEIAPKHDDISISKKSQKSKVEKVAKKKSSAISAIAQQVLDQLQNGTEKLTLECGKDSISVTNLNKIFWPAFGKQAAITKRDYLIYLAKVSDFIIPHIQDRLLTLVRFPNGINAGQFYQKHWERKLPSFVKTATIFTEHENRDQEFLVCNNLATLLWLGQIANLEIHTTHTRITGGDDAAKLPVKMSGSLEKLEQSIANYPDFMVLDLDPYLYSGRELKGAEPELHKEGFEQCREVAFKLKEHLDKLKLQAFVKTSGKTGLHIFIPIVRNVEYDTIREMSGLICRQVLHEMPDDTTMDWAVKKRKGKVFLDHNMNARSKSLASIYSPRVAPEACVSTPINWDELDTIYPTDFNTHTLPQRLLERGDIWADILSCKNDLHSKIISENKAVVQSIRGKNSKSRSKEIS